LQNVANLRTYDVWVSAVACSESVQVLSVDPVSHFHTVRYKLTT